MVIATLVPNARCALFQETILNFLILVKGPFRALLLVKSILKGLFFTGRPAESHSHLFGSNKQNHHLQPVLQNLVQHSKLLDPFVLPEAVSDAEIRWTFKNVSFLIFHIVPVMIFLHL